MTKNETIAQTELFLSIPVILNDISIFIIKISNSTLECFQNKVSW